MISMLHGKIFDKDEGLIHIDVQGVGYQVNVPQGLWASNHVGQNIKVKIYTHVREDQITLFGFDSKVQEQLFHSLLKVNGVGPKVAIGILSSATVQKFQEMVINKDLKALSGLPKIGKKTAEQILLKMGELDWSEKKNPIAAEDMLLPEIKKLKVSLVNLGFPLTEVHNVLADIDPKDSFENNFKRSLNLLSQI